jgi:hypothetical protein
MVCRADTGHRTTNGLLGGTDPFAWCENFAMTTLFDPTGFDADMLGDFRNLPFRLSASST